MLNGKFRSYKAGQDQCLKSQTSFAPIVKMTSQLKLKELTISAMARSREGKHSLEPRLCLQLDIRVAEPNPFTRK